MNINSYNPFVPNGTLKDRQLFVGREEELTAIANRMTGIQPISINIIGERKIGKSSLLYHFSQTWTERIQNHEKYIVIYLPLRGCQTEEHFYDEVANSLLQNLTSKQTQLKPILKKKSLNRRNFSRTIKKLQEKGILPVICLDDFEILLANQQQFNEGFYNNLRSLIDGMSALMLVIASRKSLGDYAFENNLSSPFFNSAFTVRLKKLAKDEAIKITHFASNYQNYMSIKLSEEDRDNALQWADNHPYKLQLACFFLWKARKEGNDITQAKRQFKQHLHEGGIQIKKNWLYKFILNFWKYLENFLFILGKLHKLLSHLLEKFANQMIGFILLVVILLFIFGVVNSEQLIEVIRNIFVK